MDYLGWLKVVGACDEIRAWCGRAGLWSDKFCFLIVLFYYDICSAPVVVLI